MREDAKKIICERPRTGGKYEKGMISVRKRLRKKPEEDEVASIAFELKSKKTKQLNDFLSPIKGFLRKCSNKKMLWDDVYSEICKVLPKDGTLQIHVHQHLDYMVEKDIVKEGDILYNSKGINIGARNYRSGIFWVDANTGILNYYKAQKEKSNYKDNLEKSKIIKYNDNYYFLFELNRSMYVHWIVESLNSGYRYMKPGTSFWVKIIITGAEKKDHIVANWEGYTAVLPFDFDVSKSNKLIHLYGLNEIVKRRVAECTFKRVAAPHDDKYIKQFSSIFNPKSYKRNQIGSSKIINSLKPGQHITFADVSDNNLIKILESLA